MGHPWNTPSGKIEIYSEALAKIAEDRELEGRLTEGQVISPIPIFDPGVEGYGAVTDEYPLYMSGNKLDKGGCINTLTTYVPSPLAHGNGPSNSIIAEVTKA